MLQLSRKWASFFLTQPETGMGYVMTSVVLKDGRRFDRACVIGGSVSSVDGQTEIPFTEDEIGEFVVTHDKRTSGK
jgi:hypothetical protein